MSLVLEGVAATHPAARAGTHAIEGVDLRVDDGEQLALIGPSGAGKTTLLTICSLQLRPAAGRVLIDGVDPWTLSTRARHALRRTLFVAPQVPPLPARQRVVTSVLAGRLPQQGLMQSIVSLIHPKRADLAFDALATMGLEDKLWQRVDRLSGGERQRVSLARLLVSDARRWLVDEPLSALDPALAEQSLRVLVDGAAARRVTLIASLHQVDLAVRCFPRLVGLAKGHLVFDRASNAVDHDVQAWLYGLRVRAARAPEDDPSTSAPGFVEDGIFIPARVH
jgi:phosphonate transport system ATP-binding protein